MFSIARYRLFASAVGAAALVAMASPAGAVLSPSTRAGYSASLTGSSATASVKARVPTLTCPGTASFQGLGAGPLLFTPAGNSFAGLVLICANGVPTYAGEYEVNGSATLLSDAVSPGDFMRGTVTESSTSTTATVADLTKGWTHTASGGGSVPTSAVIGAISVNCTNHAPPCSPVPQFTVLRFSLAMLNGQPLSSSSPTRSDIVSAGGLREVRAGALNPSGTSFNDTWIASCVPGSTNRC